MQGDIRVQQAATPPERPHKHRWMFLATKNTFDQVNPGNSDLYRSVEYAYLICNGCTTVIKEKVKTKESLDV